MILLDFNAIYHHRHNKVWEKVLQIYIPSLFGILLGVAVWWYIGREGLDRYAIHIKRFVGCIAILFALYIVAKQRALRWVDHLHLGSKTHWFVGTSAGFTSTIAHSAGPIVSLYLFAQGMGKSLFLGW